MHNAKVRELYDFMKKSAKNESTFSKTDFNDAMTHWQGTTPSTYLGKQLRTLVEKPKRGVYRVRREFLEMSVEELEKLISQKEAGLATYKRVSYEKLVTYEFLLPLSNEDKLRRTLDGLFYKDTLRLRIENVAPSILDKIVPQEAGETREEHLERAFAMVAQLFWGYSISHVSGRFRAEDLLTRTEAIDRRYIVDETTAVVRFIFPCQCARQLQGGHFVISTPRSVDENALTEEIRFIRNAFLELFVELIVVRVLEEDEIWVTETANNETRLYIWEKAS